MANRGYAKFTIGGFINKEDLQGLIAALENDGLVGEGDGANPADVCTATNGGKVWTFENSEAAGGSSPATTEFCLRHGIWYDSHCDAAHDWEAENERFRGMYRKATAEDEANGGYFITETMGKKFVPLNSTFFATNGGEDVLESSWIKRMAKDATPAEFKRALLSSLTDEPLPLVEVVDAFPNGAMRGTQVMTGDELKRFLGERGPLEGPACLEDLWKLQGELNAKAGQNTVWMGEYVDRIERGEHIPAADASGEEVAPSLLLDAGKMLNNYLNAMASEVQELRDCTSWKHWYKEAKAGRQFALYPAEIQNARVEVIDMLFFWISLAQNLGLTPDDVYRLYAKKLGINHKRQDENRSQSEHGTHEEENKTVV